MNAEQQDIEVLGPLRRTVGADRHPRGKGLVLFRIIGDLLYAGFHFGRHTRGAETRESEDGVHFVLIRLVFFAFETAKRFAFVVPRQTPVIRLVVVEGADHAGLHVAHLDPVPGQAHGIDEKGEPRPLLVERKLGDVAEGQLFARGKFAQDEVGSRPLLPLARLALGSRFAQGDPGGIFAGKREIADLVVFGLVAGRELSTIALV